MMWNRPVEGIQVRSLARDCHGLSTPYYQDCSLDEGAYCGHHASNGRSTRRSPDATDIRAGELGVRGRLIRTLLSRGGDRTHSRLSFSTRPRPAADTRDPRGGLPERRRECRRDCRREYVSQRIGQRDFRCDGWRDVCDDGC